MIPVADLHSVLAEWLPPLSLIVIAIALRDPDDQLARFRGARSLAGRQGFFLAALIVLAIAYASPIDRLSDELLTFHMVQHLLIMDIAALLLVLGLTGPLMQPLLAMRGFRWLRHPRQPAGRPAALGGDALRLAHPGALPGGDVRQQPRPRAAAPLLLLRRRRVLDAAARPAAEAELVRRCRRSAGFVFAVRLIGAVLANVLMWSSSVIYPRLRARARPRHDISAAHRPGRSPAW